jgi:hypothetical protein
MEMLAGIKYRGAQAYYTIIREEDQIYSAKLEDYEGSAHDLPPTQLILTKGIRHWIGSSEDLTLINDLGEVIDAHMPVEDLAQPATQLKNRTKRQIR